MALNHDVVGYLYYDLMKFSETLILPQYAIIRFNNKGKIYINTDERVLNRVYTGIVEQGGVSRENRSQNSLEDHFIERSDVTKAFRQGGVSTIQFDAAFLNHHDIENGITPKKALAMLNYAFEERKLYEGEYEDDLEIEADNDDSYDEDWQGNFMDPDNYSGDDDEQ